MAALSASSANAQISLTEGTNLAADISPVHGRIVFDLLGGLWTIDIEGGPAISLNHAARLASAPRWSPEGERLIYQSSTPAGIQLWLYDLSDGSTTPLSSPGRSDQFASWHPDGDRVVFSSTNSDGSLDLWELDLATGLRWRISNGGGDEVEPAWSNNGKHLVYVSRDGDIWSLMLRRRGQAEVVLYQSTGAIHAPSWRPDGSLIMFYAETDIGYTLHMVILSDPPLVREYSSWERDPFLSPVSWQDRQHLIYTADGKILSREFDDRRGRPVRFRANIENASHRSAMEPVRRTLPILTPASDRLVIRAARLYDGQSGGYRNDIDVVVDGGTISEVGPRKEYSDATVLDLGNVTILPGFIDIFSALPRGNVVTSGAGLLAYGVTTIVSEDVIEDFDPDVWHTAATPGPRLIRAGKVATDAAGQEDVFLVSLDSAARLDEKNLENVRDWQRRGVPVLAENWTVGTGLGVDLLMGATTLPSSPRGIQYDDIRAAASGGPVTLVSALADAGTPGLTQLLRSRQATTLQHKKFSVRAFATTTQLDPANASLVIGSKPNGLPPGLSLHAEFRALAAAGLGGQQILQASGINAAARLGVQDQIGRIAAGALADMVLVSGDPLGNPADALNVVAVVRNGRFYSLVSLLERATTAESVE